MQLEWPVRSNNAWVVLKRGDASQVCEAEPTNRVAPNCMETRGARRALENSLQRKSKRSKEPYQRFQMPVSTLLSHLVPI